MNKMYLNMKVYDKAARGIPKQCIEVANYQEASEAYLKFIEEHMLSVEDLSIGLIHSDGIPIARVSYNGKVWGCKEDRWHSISSELFYDPYDKEQV